MVKKDDTLKAEEKPQAREVRRSCNLNLAAAYLREKDYKGAAEASTQVGIIAAPYQGHTITNPTSKMVLTCFDAYLQNADELNTN